MEVELPFHLLVLFLVRRCHSGGARRLQVLAAGSEVVFWAVSDLFRCTCCTGVRERTAGVAKCVAGMVLS